MHVSGTLVLLVGLFGTFGTGCYVRARVYASDDVVVFHEAPTLVLVEPGVYVVSDYDYPVYYTDGYYWRVNGGVWYRTSHWSDPWVTIHGGGVPGHLSTRNHSAYVHYRARAGAQVWRQQSREHRPPSGGGHDGASASASAGGDTRASSRASTSDATSANDNRSDKDGRSDKDARSGKDGRDGKDAADNDARGAKDSQGKDSHADESKRPKDEPTSRSAAEANEKSEKQGKSRSPSESRPAASPSGSSPSKKSTKTKKKSRR